MKNHMDSKLYDAVIKDNTDVLKEMENKLSINNERTPGDSTVLHLACQYGSTKCVEAILSTVHESFLFKINWRGETGLHLAAREGHYEVVVALIAAAKSLLSSEEPNIINFPKETSSTSTSTTDHVQNLIRMPNVELETALHAAVRYGHFDVVNLLVKQDPTHSYSPNKHNETPLYLASVRCHTDIIKVILDNCESPTFGGPAGRTALHAAVLDDGGHGNMKLLLEKKKDLIQAADNYGWTAYHYVAYNNLYKLVEDLVSVDNNYYSMGYLVDKDYSRTALHVAAYRGNARVMEELVKYFPDCWEMIDGSGENILHIAIQQGQKEVIKFILSQGSKANGNLFNQRDSEGNTPLHLISKLGSYVPRLINELAIKVDWEVLNSKDLTPMDVVRWAKETDTLVDQTHFRTLTRGNVEKHRDLWDIEKGRRQNDDNDSGKKRDFDLAKRKLKKLNKKKTEFETAMNSHMIVAALITTVALTAGFAMPGGFDGNQVATQGSAILSRKTAFKAFIVTDAIALLFSISSLFLHFMTTIIIYNNGGTKKDLYGVSTLFNIVSIVAMVLAFMTGTYAVLAHSPQLAITVSVISSLFFLFAFYIFIRLGLFNNIQIRSVIRRSNSRSYSRSNSNNNLIYSL